MTVANGGPHWLRRARRDVGVREVTGPKDNPKIMEYYRAVGHDWVEHDEVAWCAAYIGACLEKSGLASTRSLRARSYQKWGRRLARPRKGCIVVLKRTKNPAFGHLGFLEEETDDHVILLGGNQSNAVNLSRFPKSRIVALRWPRTADVASFSRKNTAFETALEPVLSHEGGWSDHPEDPGGPTFRGVTLGLLADHLGLEVKDSLSRPLKDELKTLSDGQIKTIYYQHFWLVSFAYRLPRGLDLIHFDASVQHGPARAARMLQRVLDVEVDGEIGPNTIRAARRLNSKDTVAAYGAVRETFYRSLKHFPTFGRGWMRRLTDITAKSRDRVSARKTINHQQKETTTMKSEQKWWAESLTIWGTLITALSTVLPIIGPFIGLDISSVMIEQFGEAVALLIQAVGGVSGSLMAVYGRLRAESRLSRRNMILKV